MNGSKIVNRRKGPDTMTKAIGVISGITWLFVLAIFIVVTYAKPQVESKFFTNQFGGQASTTWDHSMLNIAMFMLALVVIVCFIGILINASRHKRRTDRFNKTLIFFGIVSFIGFIYMIFIK